MSDKEERDAYTALFLTFSEQAERWLRRALFILFISICLFQAALNIPVFRHLLASSDKYEGVPIHRPESR
ncbi:hypothetical protein DFP94_101833 [Fontibacillus phaseoli]|uniref:Uncharacterized protein n=1 Tax=Fontibacillus phaseoli TaxID=1416533 RepID=A0A369BRL9_9BACL|nr:hypothetical protein [Fontibacillus phaseoli]RCX23236.1 hypothetical protein DFP94_101833 [Fontibacillus phaseoli]